MKCKIVKYSCLVVVVISILLSLFVSHKLISLRITKILTHQIALISSANIPGNSKLQASPGHTTPLNSRSEKDKIKSCSTILDIHSGNKNNIRYLTQYTLTDTYGIGLINIITNKSLHYF